MSQTANTIPPAGLGKLTKGDIWKSALIVVFPHFIAIVKFLIASDHWPTWHEWQPYVDISAITLLTYIGKNLGTNNVGELFTANKPTTTISTEKLQEVIAEAKP